MSAQAVDLFGPAGNVTLLERPLHSVTLLSAVKVALRARLRQREVQELIEQREMVLSGVQDAYSTLNHEWRYTYVNDRVAALARMKKEEILRRRIWDVFPETIGSDFYKLAHQAMDERKAVQLEYFHEPWQRCHDTRIVPTRAGIFIFRTDITERKEQEMLAHERAVKLQASEGMLRLPVEAADIGTFDCYPKTGELRWSERCKALRGLPPEAPVDYALYLAGVHPDDRHLAHETARKVSQPDSAARYAIEYRTLGAADGEERWVAERGRAVLDPEGHATRFIGTILDVTARKSFEIALQRAKQERRKRTGRRTNS